MNTVYINDEKFCLFFKQNRIELSEIKKGMAIDNPEKITGFSGVMLTLPNVYISENLNIRLQCDPSVEEELKSVLSNIIREDYGFISEDEKQFNAEQRWLAGSFYDVIARFDISCGRVEFTGYDGYAVIRLNNR